VTIAIVSTGALSQDPVTITPAYGSGVTAGNLAVLTVLSGHPLESIPQTPSGWTQVDTLSGGGGTFGAGTGPRRLTWFVRVLLGSDAAPTTVIPSATGSFIAGRIQIFSRSGGTGWRWGSSTGADITSGTAFSDTGTNPLSWATGDMAVAAFGICGSGSTFSAESVTAAGITFGTFTEQSDDQITATGNHGAMATATGLVTAGAATVDPTIACTLSSASTGVAGVIRLRQASAALAVTAQAGSVFPPRVLTSVTGMLAENIASASVYRIVGSVHTPVRAATAVDVTAQDALLRVDAEQPFGIATSYGADLTDLNGDTWTVLSGSITSTVTAGYVISDAIQGIGAGVAVEDWPSRDRDRGATIFNVGGRLVTVSRPRSGFQGTVTLRTDVLADGNSLQQTLGTATEGVVMLRAQTTDARFDCYIVAISDSERPQWFSDVEWWDLTIAQADAWPDTLEAAGFTLQDVANNYTSLLDLSNANATLLILALRSF
jgi:hypothetical protein